MAKVVADAARRWTWILLAGSVTILAGVLSTAKNLPVLVPLVAAVCVACLFYASLVDGGRGAVIELGTVYVAVVTLYAVLPLAGYIANGLEYSLTNDNRLYLYQPTPRELGRIAWFYVLHLACFSVAYRMVRGRARFRMRLCPPERLRVLLIVGLLVSIVVYFWLLGRVFNLSASDYTGSYLVYSRLPLLVAQVTNHLGGMRFTVEVALLAILFVNFHKYRFLIATALLAETLATFAWLGSRTEFVLLWLAAAVLYHWVVRPVSERGLAVGGGLVVGLFLVVGFLRSGILESGSWDGWNVFARSNEFETLFANAYEIDHLKADGSIGPLPLGFYLADLFAVVPQQILPIPKINPADWYVSTFYPESAAQGAGLAFGTLSESILSGGRAGVVLRALVLGGVLALVHRSCARSRASFWPLIIYLWTILQVYQAFRSTTFCLLALFLYRVAPVILFVEIARSLGRSERTRVQGHGRPIRELVGM